MRTLAIGDIHGCNLALTTLLAAVKLTLQDRVIFLGDYIDRGAASRQVIETLLHIEETCSPIFLRGNHEAMILEAREDILKSHLWQSYGGLETAFSYGADFSQDWARAIPAAHWSFIERTERYYETDREIFVHAYLDPDLDMKDQPDWLLFWENFERLKPHRSGKKIICGHTRQRSGNIVNNEFAVCLDTGPADGGWLTCLEPSSGKFWQTNEKSEIRTGTI